MDRYIVRIVGYKPSGEYYREYQLGVGGCAISHLSYVEIHVKILNSFICSFTSRNLSYHSVLRQ